MGRTCSRSASPRPTVEAMSARRYARLTRLAALSLGSVAVVLVARALGGTFGLVLFVLAAVPVYLAIGPYQADLALNQSLTEDERRWWRVALFLLPWTMSVYWLRHVRR